ncbi:MAG: hypothetical protein ACTSUX_08225 [Promethearchaeota archaeon]
MTVNKSIKCSLGSFIIIFLLVIGFWSTFTRANEGSPTPQKAFNGHNFTENYWDIYVFNNSKWDHPCVEPGFLVK